MSFSRKNRHRLHGWNNWKDAYIFFERSAEVALYLKSNILRFTVGFPFHASSREKWLSLNQTRNKNFGILGISFQLSSFNCIENIPLNPQKANIKKTSLPFRLVSQYHNANIWLLSMYDGCFERIIDFVARCSVHCSDIVDDTSSRLAPQHASDSRHAGMAQGVL